MCASRINSTLERNLLPFVQLGKILHNPDTVMLYFDPVIQQQSQQNVWFTPQFCHKAIESIAAMLEETNLYNFASHYPTKQYHFNKRLKVAVISAGNIPLAAFHDFCCILLSGNDYCGKLSSQDKLLLPKLAQLLIDIEPAYKDRIAFVDKVSDFDAIIATGSDNSTRYFEYYFQNYPHLLRHNRNSIAIFNGSETDEDLKSLCSDIYLYFGLGCRSVSKIFVPEHYDFTRLIDIMQQEIPESVLSHHQYLNNLEYQKAIRLMNNRPYIDAGSLIFSNETPYSSPISVVHYQEYQDFNKLQEIIEQDREYLQCIVSNDLRMKGAVPFGKTQQPTLSDYPDNEDIMKFMEQLTPRNA